MTTIHFRNHTITTTITNNLVRIKVNGERINQSYYQSLSDNDAQLRLSEILETISITLKELA